MEGQAKKITLSCTVDPYRSGWTIVEFLSHRFPYHNADRWTQRVRQNQVTVNGLTIDPVTAVHKDDEIRYTIFHAEPKVDFRYDVVYEDDHILAVSKSGNLPVHACGVFITHTLISRLRETYGDKISLAHRLDRETSGVVLLSKNKQTAKALGRMFQQGEISKRYLTIVRGRPAEKRFEVDAPIAKVPALTANGEASAQQEWLNGNDSERSKVSYLPKREVNAASGKAAKTMFVHLHDKGDFTVLEAVPITGRTNQIRVHLAHVGYPIVGDKVYGLNDDLKEETLSKGLTERVRQALVMDRQALHCTSLEFTHPMTDAAMRIEAPVPDDMKWAWE
jgi:23S rRNA pseudouridine955/2504/2580 synthase/23S rRNA pseudouridine1911/1915/1917 synthase